MRPLEFSILLVLAEGAEYGYGIVKRIAEAEAGGIRLAPSNLYYVLDRMMAGGLVEETGDPEPGSGVIPRRYYRITRRGRAALSEEAERLAAVMTTAERLRLVSRGGS